MGERRSYTVELESAPVGQTVTDELLERFASDLFANQRIAGPAPAADGAREVLELRTSVDASSPSNALAIAEVAFMSAAEKAGLKVDVTLANVWLDEALDDDGVTTAPVSLQQSTP